MHKIDRSEVLDKMKLHLQRRRDARRQPLIILKEQLSSVVGCDFDTLRPVLLDLYHDGLLLTGRTLNTTYFTLPEYV
jgi:hypothetical protein